jgi:predicted nuclease with TOPRIM domain
LKKKKENLNNHVDGLNIVEIEDLKRDKNRLEKKIERLTKELEDLKEKNKILLEQVNVNSHNSSEKKNYYSIK